MYYVPGVYEEFMDNYSLTLRASFGQAWDKYIAMKKANTVIRTISICTDYKQRIPLFDEDGNSILDEVYNEDYTLGDKLGEGLLFSFERYTQFYYYFVPVEMVKLNNDRVKMKRLSGEFCIAKKGVDPNPIGESIKNNKEFNEFVDFICNDGGWYIKRTVEGGLIDWDFISQNNPADYFYSRLN
jgi:predicted membrane-bound dolichyl-phosphate-mannose-protein mannosyltransferase